jgi:arachidonate 15-lipoxygenase
MQTLASVAAEHAAGPYAYDHDSLGPLAMQKGLPREELPSHAWFKTVLRVAMEVSHNQREANIEREHIADLAAQLAHPNTNEVVELIRSVWHRVDAASPTGRPTSLADYEDQFRTISLPPMSSLLHDDDAFAWLRVAGANPTAIQQVSDPRPLTNEGLRSVAGFAEDDLDALVSSGRLVAADYREALADIESGDYPDGPKYAYQPAAWFGMPKGSRRLTPIAILPGADQPLQYAPPAGEVSWGWNAAKSVLASADDTHHQIVSHLARTHLFVEPFIVATHLALPIHHPVSLLLRPHFEGTIFINWSAMHFLVSKGGGVDQIQGGTIASDLKVAAESLTRTPFEQSMVPRGFAARGFGDAVPFEYPYRDDALALWDAIRDWVASYLAVFYRDDGAVQSDRDLQQWSALIRAQDGGRVPTFSQLQSSAQLVDALAAIIYAASAMHAAGNFPQSDITLYTPLTPGAGYQPVGKAIAATTEAEWLEMLPPLDMAALQLRIRYTLGSVHYTQLGRYELTWFLPTKRNVEIQQRLGSFHHKLAGIEAAINARNARLPAAFQYPYLLPSQVPQSINI